jgi:hypothetical protein
LSAASFSPQCQVAIAEQLGEIEGWVLSALSNRSDHGVGGTSSVRRISGTVGDSNYESLTKRYDERAIVADSRLTNASLRDLKRHSKL